MPLPKFFLPFESGNFQVSCRVHLPGFKKQGGGQVLRKQNREKKEGKKQGKKRKKGSSIKKKGVKY